MDLAGQTVSHYHVLRQLGSGGMGVVYEAEDQRLRRRVALKFLPDSPAHDEKALQRFLREARAASSLNHPNICTIYEVEEQDGRPVIVMELLQGTTLKQRLTEGLLSEQLVLDLAIGVCEGLEAAHSQGIIHRDIKPANIFVTARGTAKILDFGLAKLVPITGAANNGDAAAVQPETRDLLTVIGVVHGTTRYMSPEQASGEELDSRTDLFSFGAVLYEMATGTHPFARRNAILTVDAILNSTPDPVSKSNASIRPELEAIITKALEKRREQRYQTAAEITVDLKRVRRALDTSQEPFTTVVPGAISSAPAPHQSARPAPTRRQRRFTTYFAAAAALLLVVVIAGGLLRRRHSTVLSEKDTIVLADFDNKTGDSVFDGTLKLALATDLQQSPFLNIVSDQRVRETLRLMGRSPTERLGEDAAREVCERVGGKALLAGSIVSLGSYYVTSLKAVNCVTGDSLALEEEEAARKEDVLQSLHRAATRLRGKMGESLASIEKFDTPVEQATTSSLQALQAFSEGIRARWQRDDAQAIPFFQRAIELDPNFAMAYLYLAISHHNLGARDAAVPYATKAYTLRNRVSEREHCAIAGVYYSFVTGEIDKEIAAWQVCERLYPRYFAPHLNVGLAYAALGRYENAVAATRDALAVEPDNGNCYGNLMIHLMALNRLEESKSVYRSALEHKVDNSLVHLERYNLGFLEHDSTEMQAQLGWAAGKPAAEMLLVWVQSDSEAFSGRVVKAREYSHRTVQSAVRAGEKETAAEAQLELGLREAEMGFTAEAQQNVADAQALASTRDVQTLTALLLARVGKRAEAERIADKLEAAYPSSTLLDSFWLPAIRAAIEIDRKNPAKAVELLETSAPYELGTFQPLGATLYPVYLRGQAYLSLDRGKEAAAEFRKFVDHPGIVVNYPLAALARLGIARAYVLQGDTSKARIAYGDFLTLWKDADSNIPILKQAKAEYAKLQ